MRDRVHSGWRTLVTRSTRSCGSRQCLSEGNSRNPRGPGAGFLASFLERHVVADESRPGADRVAAVLRAVRFIGARLDSPLRVADIAAVSGYSQYHFTRLFKGLTGLAPHAFVIRARVERAKDLLACGGSIAETAFDVGFSDQAHLTRCFSRLAGVTPRAFIEWIAEQRGGSAACGLQLCSDKEAFMIRKINLARAFEQFEDTWAPRVAGDINQMQVKLVRLQGEFVWHHHEAEDELFLILEGRMRLRVRNQDDVVLESGEMVIVPRGVEHCPVAEVPTKVLLFEPAATLNTGNTSSERTVWEPEKLASRSQADSGVE